MLETCYEKAVETLKACSTRHGLFASAGKKGYDAIWARDTVISFLGGSLIEDKKLKETFKKSLILLAENQSANGQIPNAVDKYSERPPHTDYKTIDSSLWYIIGHYIYKERYKTNSLFNQYKAAIEKALQWLRCQDPGEIGMLAQLPTSDWQDAFPHKYGYTINTQALYYKVLKLTKDPASKKLKDRVNNNKDDKLWFSNFYIPYRWKNHNKYKEMGHWFDSLGNLLAINFDLADEYKAKKILSYIKEKRISRPYPIKVISPPIKKNSKDWQDYYLDSGAGKPNSYANGGIWGFVGCFYVLALIKYKKFKEAEKELKKIAEVNLKGNFPEWTHPKTKRFYGKLQAWEAGMYILAYRSLLEKKVLI
ncbi:MAG: hypothetical protein KKG75_04280 [Nanoarchaeota archaeon]|nr:hypothetical protein [Nanoarchaeota archaeon]